MNTEHHIEDIKIGIKSGRYVNEASVSQGIVLRLLQTLGWPTYDTQVVCPEYSLEGRRVDFGLCHPASKPIAFIEVKQVGKSDGAERQLFEYAFHVGVPLAILTDGREWNFFLPAEQGDYGERRVYKLDLVERDVAECILRLRRYLGYEEIINGRAIAAARDDYRSLSRDRQMKAMLPEAWQKLISEPDDLLLELLADRVESLCGFKPDLDTVAAFMAEFSAARSQYSVATIPRKNPVVVNPVVSRARNAVSTSAIVPGVGFMLEGKHYPRRSARDVMVSVFEALGAKDPAFFNKFAALPKHGKIRRYLARTPEELYPGRPDLAQEHSERLSGGWYIGTNVSRSSIRTIIEMACDVANVRFGKDLQVNLGE